MIAPGARIVFCGTAAGTASARAGAYYAGPGNRFWRTLHEVDLTPRELKPSEYIELPTYGIGLTDLCKVTSGSDAEVGVEHFDTDRLKALLEQFASSWLAFNGKKAAQSALGRSVDYGPQPEKFGPAGVYVLPSTSAAARRYWDIAPWRELAARADT